MIATAVVRFGEISVSVDKQCNVLDNKFGTTDILSIINNLFAKLMCLQDLVRWVEICPAISRNLGKTTLESTCSDLE